MYRIAIDAGHGRGNRGASANGLVEDDVVFDLAQRLGHHWRELFGPDSTFICRPGPDHVDNTQRALRAKQAGCKAVVSLHLNAAMDPRARGLTFWIRAHDQADRQLAISVREACRAAQLAMPIGASAIYEDTQSHVRRIAVLRVSGDDMPAVLIECGFISNPQDAELLRDPHFRERLVIAIRDGVARYLGGDAK